MKRGRCDDDVPQSATVPNLRTQVVQQEHQSTKGHTSLLSSITQHHRTSSAMRSASHATTAASVGADGNGSTSTPAGAQPPSPPPTSASASSSAAVWDPDCVRGLLKRTNLAHLRDGAIVAWLRDACEWVVDASASHPDVRFYIIGVLETLPWWRYMSVDGTHISRNHIKTMLQLERLCMILVSLSQHVVRSVVEVVMKPFTTPKIVAPESEGLRVVIPVDMACRVLNHITIKYPHLAPDVLLGQCIEPLMPKRRWPYEEHHIAFLEMLLHLALDATLAPLEAEHEPLIGAGAGGGHGTTSKRGESPRPRRDSCGEATSDATPTSGTASTSVYDSEATVSSSITTSGGAAPTVPGAGVDALPQNMSLLREDTTAVAHNNRLMLHRNAIVQLILRHLLDMELTLTFTDLSAPHAGGGHPQHGGAGPRSSTSSGAAAVTVAPSDVAALKILRRCTEFVYQHLANDLRTQGEAGACGNTSWWREVLSFHVNSVLMLQRPVVLHTLAPRLALVGTSGEGADMVHRVVSTVLKGIVHTWPPPSTSAAPRPSHAPRGMPARLLPPSAMMAPQVLPSERRISAAKHLAPLILYLCPALASDASVANGAMRRMLKWLATENLGAGGGSRSTHSLVETVFAQTLWLAAALGVPLSSDLPQELIASLSASLRADASVAEGEELACAKARGLLVVDLYDGPSMQSADQCL